MSIDKASDKETEMERRKKAKKKKKTHESCIVIFLQKHVTKKEKELDFCAI